MDFCHPIGRKVSIGSHFGLMRTFDNGKPSMHVGVDIGGGGLNLYAIEDSKVVELKSPPKNIDDKKSLTTLLSLKGNTTNNIYRYKHLFPDPKLEIGSLVKMGQQIGVTDNYGPKSTGAHLHLEMPMPITPPVIDTRNKQFPKSKASDGMQQKNLDGSVGKVGTKFYFGDVEQWLEENITYDSNEKTFFKPSNTEVTSIVKTNSNASKKFEIDTGSFSNLVDIVTLKGII